MQFTKESSLVIIWVGNVQSGLYTLEQVPNLFNLKEVVSEVING